MYYEGESANYWPELYEPYLNYHAPIVAIPGNHDGDVNPATGETSLQGFVRTFCSQSAIISPDNRESPRRVRRTVTHPNVFWTMNTPLVTIIGLYSNCPEGGQISDTCEAAQRAPDVVLTGHVHNYTAFFSSSL